MFQFAGRIVQAQRLIDRPDGNLFAVWPDRDGGDDRVVIDRQLVLARVGVPNFHLLIDAARDNFLAVSRHIERRDGPLMTGEIADEGAAVGIPDLGGGVAAAGDDRLPASAKVHHRDRCLVPGERVQHLAARHIPYLRGAVGAGRRQALAVGADGGGPDRRVVAGEVAGLRDDVEVPQPGGVIDAGGRQLVAGRIERQAANFRVMALERPHDLAGFRIEKANDAVGGADEDRLAVLAENGTGVPNRWTRRRNDAPRGAYGERRPRKVDVVNLQAVRAATSQAAIVGAEGHMIRGAAIVLLPPVFRDVLILRDFGKFPVTNLSVAHGRRQDRAVAVERHVVNELPEVGDGALQRAAGGVVDAHQARIGVLRSCLARDDVFTVFRPDERLGVGALAGERLQVLAAGSVPDLDVFLSARRGAFRAVRTVSQGVYVVGVSGIGNDFVTVAEVPNLDRAILARRS